MKVAAPQYLHAGLRFHHVMPRIKESNGRIGRTHLTLFSLKGEQRDVVGRLLARIGSLQCAAAAAEATRRQLHNQMVELRGNVRDVGRSASRVTCLIDYDACFLDDGMPF